MSLDNWRPVKNDSSGFIFCLISHTAGVYVQLVLLTDTLISLHPQSKNSCILNFDRKQNPRSSDNVDPHTTQLLKSLTSGYNKLHIVYNAIYH